MYCITHTTVDSSHYNDEYLVWDNCEAECTVRVIGPFAERADAETALKQLFENPWTDEGLPLWYNGMPDPTDARAWFDGDKIQCQRVFRPEYCEYRRETARIIEMEESSG